MRCHSRLCLVEVPLMPSSLFASCRRCTANKQLYFAFVDLEKAFDCVTWMSYCGPWGASVSSNGLCGSFRVVHQCLESCIWVNARHSKEFGMGVAVQGLVLNPLLLILVLECFCESSALMWPGCSCSFCCSRVSNKSIELSQCNLWVHKRGSGITGWLVADPNYICPRCHGKAGPIESRPVIESSGCWQHHALCGGHFLLPRWNVIQGVQDLCLFDYAPQ